MSRISSTIFQKVRMAAFVHSFETSEHKLTDESSIDSEKGVPVNVYVCVDVCLCWLVDFNVSL